MTSGFCLPQTTHYIKWFLANHKPSTYKLWGYTCLFMAYINIDSGTYNMPLHGLHHHLLRYNILLYTNIGPISSLFPSSKQHYQRGYSNFLGISFSMHLKKHTVLLIYLALLPSSFFVFFVVAFFHPFSLLLFHLIHSFSFFIVFLSSFIASSFSVIYFCLGVNIIFHLTLV
jgi:hypothetical protein